MDNLLLPKTYLSYSAMTMWLKNPDRFKREYFENAEKLDTKYLRFGKGVAKMIEDGSHTSILPDLPVYDTPEHEIRCTVLGVPILGFIDSYNSIDNVFLEYKTGKKPWSQSLVQKHDQLPFYAMLLKCTAGEIPAYCDLVWIETEDTEDDKSGPFSNEKKINVTGKVKSFRREFDYREIERMEELVVKVANEISDAYKEWLKDI